MGIGVTPVRTPQCGFVHSKCVWDEARLSQSRVGDGPSQICGDQLGRYEFIRWLCCPRLWESLWPLDISTGRETGKVFTPGIGDLCVSMSHEERHVWGVL